MLGPQKGAYGLLPEKYKYSSIMTYWTNIALGYEERNVAINIDKKARHLIYVSGYLIICKVNHVKLIW